MAVESSIPIRIKGEIKGIENVWHMTRTHIYTHTQEAQREPPDELRDTHSGPNTLMPSNLALSYHFVESPLFSAFPATDKILDNII